ncbi:MAG: ATP-binding protein [Permianibacter sp.]
MKRLLTSIFLLLAFTGMARGEEKAANAILISEGRRCLNHDSEQAPRSTEEYVRDINACIAEGKNETAFALAISAKERAAATHAKDDLIRLMVVEASVLTIMELMDEALTRYRQAIDTWKPENRIEHLITALNNAAGVLLELNQAEEALQWVERANQLISSTNDELLIASTQCTLADVQVKLRNFKAARSSFESCHGIAKKHDSRFHLIYVHKGIAELQMAQNELDDALSAVDKAIELSLSRQMRATLPALYRIKAQVLRQQGRREESTAAASLGLIEAEASGQLKSEHDLWDFLRMSRLERGEWREAVTAYDKLLGLKQRIYSTQLANALAFERAKHQLTEKESEIQTLRQQSSMQQADAERARAERTAVIAVSLLVLAVFAVGYSRWIHKRDLARAEAANQELKRLNELKDQFLANTSHELRTPLNGIIGLSDIILVEEQERLSSEAQDNLRMIRDCGNQLSQLVDDILDFSRLRAEKLVLNKQPLQLVDAIDDVVKLLRPLATAKGLNLSSRVAAELPSISADGDRIRQVLHNLIGNAIKFTEQGSVTVDADRHGDQLRVQIRDTGVGIPADRLERIFEPFEQADGSSGRRYGGAGLGLSIARQLVVAHGGSLTVLSEPGRGSVFSFSLPLA